MQGTNKIILNTIILYVKILVCMSISLWTVPIVLDNLGEHDFGVFNLVSGIIAMLAFLNGAMTVSTQRYLSVTKGQNDTKKLQEVFNLSIVLHLIIGLLVIFLIEISIPFLIKYAIKIPSYQTDIVWTLFHYLAISICFTIITVPFDAVLNAYENMLAFSIFGIVESLIRLAIAIALQYVAYDKLNFYGYCTMLIAIIIFLLKYLYIRKRYRHLTLSPRHCKNRSLFLELCSFASWNTLNSIALIGRNQGLAITLNHFFGPIINAAYGIGNQINGVLGYFSQTIQKSITPQLMESHGANDQQKLEMMVFGLTKYSTLSMSIVAIPLYVEMPFILDMWLPKVPIHTISFARYIIIMTILFQLSSGSMSAIQSTGRLKWYTIIVSTMLLSTIPLSYAMLNMGHNANIALQIACIMEILLFFTRLTLVARMTEIHTIRYLTHLTLPILVTITVTVLTLYAVTILLPPSFPRLILNCAIGVIVFCAIAYHITLSTNERNKFSLMLSKAIDIITQRRRH